MVHPLIRSIDKTQFSDPMDKEARSANYRLGYRAAIHKDLRFQLSNPYWQMGYKDGEGDLERYNAQNKKTI